ncbi:helix-turn-helix domain-containing protein [Streptomyces abyssomicinicus]|uniref:helix-turn-helix domain-containing protein n=1 Tax=Streptomyces abyssomicinicus TaxID=574929 RepID=UPI00124F7A56|nr:helix-turn-helix domain-containing protein [Streptomyces abyssomicinicus]
MLEGLGVEPTEEQVYVELVSRSAKDVRELAGRTGLGVPDVEAALTGLEAKGLVTRLSGSRSGLRAAPPDVNLNLLMLHRMDDARRARHAITELTARYRREAGYEPAEPIEVIEGAEPLAERYNHLLHEAQHEVRSLVRAPAVAVPADDNAGQQDALRAGVRYRVVYQRDLLDTDGPDAPLLLKEWAELGEEMRVAVEVPLKLVLVDDRIAIVVPDQSGQDEVTALLVRNRAMVDALGWIFQRCWESAVPVPTALAEAEGPLAAEDRYLLSLLLAGYTDQAIASQQNVSLRTVQRRVRRLLALANAQSRVQLGWQAARREWV